MRTVALALVLVSSTAAAQPPEPIAPQGIVGASSIPGLAPDLAFADPVDVNPGSGRRKLVAGWLSVTLSAGNIVDAAVMCDERQKFLSARGCMRTSIAFASLTMLIGVPLLVAGYRQRSRYHAWRERHGLSGLSLGVRGDARQPTPWLSYGASF